MRLLLSDDLGPHLCSANDLHFEVELVEGGIKLFLPFRTIPESPLQLLQQLLNISALELCLIIGPILILTIGFQAENWPPLRSFLFRLG